MRSYSETRRTVIAIVVLLSPVAFGSPNLSGQYWFGSLSVDVDTNAPWAKRGTVSIAGNQWHQEWDDGNGHHTFSSAFTTTAQPDGSINVSFPEQTYNVAWSGDVMIHAGSVLGGGGEGIDIFTRKATNLEVNDVLGDHSYFGYHLGSIWPGDSCGWGDFTLTPNDTVTYTFTDDRGTIESGIIGNWALNDANAVIDVLGPITDASGAVIQDLGHAALFLGKGGIGFMWGVFPEEGRDGDLGYSVFIKKTNQVITMADIAGTYQVRFLETGPGGVPYTCGQGTCVIDAVDDAKGILSVDAYYSDGEHSVERKDCSVGPGNEFHLDDDGVPDGIVSPDKNLIFGPEYRYKEPPTREDYDWLGGVFLVRTPDHISDPNGNGDWGQLSSMKTARDQFAGAVIGNEIFVFGGNAIDDTDLYCGERYNIATDTWSDIADNPYYENPDDPWSADGVEDVSGIGYNGRFYVFGAAHGYNYNEMYDPATNTWTTLAKKPTATSAAVPVLYEGEIYLFGGWWEEDGDEIDLSIVEVYDPNQNTWRCAMDMPKPLVSHAVAVHDHFAYLIGGYDEHAGEMNDKVMRYDFQTDTWIQNYCEARPDAARVYPRATQAPVINGKVYLIGGGEGESYEDSWAVDTFTIFDIKLKDWSSGPALPEPRAFPLTVISDNTIYVIGGNNFVRGGETEFDDTKDTVFALPLADTPDHRATVGVHRLWSATYGRHFYTIDASEKDGVLADSVGAWQDEGVVYLALADADEPNVAPVYRLFSESLNSYFYTINESEKDRLIDDYPDVWMYEKIAFYVFPEGQQPADASPVYRFWSDVLGCHFYTIDESESDNLVNDHSDVWTYEAVAWYAYES